MTDDFLYRYISFENFVDMVQKKALTFVLPSLWDDPHEETPFYRFVNTEGSSFSRAFFLAMKDKIYAQCWTELSESDAMWRIYSFNNRSLRVKVNKENISRLDDVVSIPVVYSDDEFSIEELNEKTFFSSLAYKRMAFSHEREVRLIKRFRYMNEADAELHIKALMVVADHPQKIEILESSFPGDSLEEQLNCVIKLLNIGNVSQKTSEVSFAEIPDFIEGILVHPMAPEWYVAVVQEFCIRNNIPFEGKSDLYN